MAQNTKNPSDKRRAERKKILESFHIFLTVSKLGAVQFHLKDISDTGIAFVCDPAGMFRVDKTYDAFFYLNAGLRIPIKFRVVRMFNTEDGLENVGCELIELSEKAKTTFQTFTKFLDDLVEVTAT